MQCRKYGKTRACRLPQFAPSRCRNSVHTEPDPFSIGIDATVKPGRHSPLCASAGRVFRKKNTGSPKSSTQATAKAKKDCTLARPVSIQSNGATIPSSETLGTPLEQYSALRERFLTSMVTARPRKTGTRTRPGS